MERSRPGFLTTALIICVAVVPLATSAQAGPHPQAVPPDHQLPAHQVEATDTGAAERNETTPVGTDGVLLHVDVSENGSAAWRIEYRTRFDDHADRAAFQRLQQDLENGSATANQGFYNRIRGTIEAAEEATGREMSGTNFEVQTAVRRIPQEYGVVVYSFRWQGFAAKTDRGLHAGDALDGFFLSSGERLVISWPEGYELAEVEPTPDAQRDRSVVWRGPTTFGSDGPLLHFTEQTWPGSRLVPFGVAATVAALAAVVWTLRRRVGFPPAPLGEWSSDDEEEPALLSNEERVVRLLEERGGRIKQQEVADELGWTEAKTSYVVSNLREEQWIRSFRIGPENVLSLADSLDSHQSEA